MEYAFRNAANSGALENVIGTMSRDGWLVQELIKEQQRFWVLFQRVGVDSVVLSNEIDRVYEELNLLADRVNSLEKPKTRKVQAKQDE